MKRAMIWMAASVVALVLVGCGDSGPRPFAVNVSLDESLARAAGGSYPSLEVDVVGLSPNDAIGAVSVVDWFEPGSAARRNSHPETLYFSSENAAPKTVSAKAKFWDQWTDGDDLLIDKLLVLVSYLPEASDPDASQRLELSLDPDDWVGRVFNIQVLSDRIRCTTVPKLTD